MSLLDINYEESMDSNLINSTEINLDYNWEEYDELDAELQKSLQEIDKMCLEVVDEVDNLNQLVENNKLYQDYVAVHCAWIWWILAINVLWIHQGMKNQNRLRICL